MVNPRYANGSLRRKHRARLKAMNCECGICHGRFGPIHYDEPSDAAHPLSFVVDEIKPIARWKQFGYASPRAAAEDWNGRVWTGISQALIFTYRWAHSRCPTGRCIVLQGMP